MWKPLSTHLGHKAHPSEFNLKRTKNKTSKRKGLSGTSESVWRADAQSLVEKVQFPHLLPTMRTEVRPSNLLNRCVHFCWTLTTCRFGLPSLRPKRKGVATPQMPPKIWLLGDTPLHLDIVLRGNFPHDDGNSWWGICLFQIHKKISLRYQRLLAIHQTNITQLYHPRASVTIEHRRQRRRFHKRRDSTHGGTPPIRGGRGEEK